MPPGENPLGRTSAEVRQLGWIPPRGEAYVSSLLTYAGMRCLLSAAESKPFQWLVLDLDRRTAMASARPQTADRDGLLLYGSTTRDDRGDFYLVGAETAPKVAVYSVRGKLALCDLTRSIMKGAWMWSNSRRMCVRGESRSIDWSISS